MTDRATPHIDQSKPAPPPLGRWGNIYLLVLAELGALVLLFYAISRWAS